MKILKFVGLGLISVIALLLLVGLFLKKEYLVERNVTIHQNRSHVFDYLKFLKNQDNFSVWAKMDPAMKKEFRGEDAQVGFISAWDSKNDEVGKGEQEIKKIALYERIDYELRFIKPFKSKSDAYLITEVAGENETKVTWGFQGKMNYPMNLMQLFMNMEKMIGNDLSQGLINLKEILETTAQ
jgi:hypothetical protein